MEEKKIPLSFYQIDILKSEDTLSFYLEKLGSGIDTIDELRLLNYNSPFIVEAEINEEEDEYVFSFSLCSRYLPFSTICEESIEVRLKAARNLTYLYDSLSYGVLPVIHPECVYFDDNYFPVVTLRYVRNMRKFEEKKNDYLQDLKAMILALVYVDFEWEDVYKTSGQVIKDQESVSIRDKQNINEIADFLTESLQKEIAQTKKEKLLVKKTEYRWIRLAALIAPVVAVLLVIPLVFYTFFEIPAKNTVINASTHFLANDYSSVINSYSGTSINNMSASTKYQLAYSYIQLSGLSTKQKSTILSNLSVRSVEDYFDYWIYYGRNDFENAHETAKTLQDIELKYYAVIGYLNYLQTDSDLKGSKKEEKIKEYTSLKQAYEKELNDIVGGGDNE